MKTILFLTAAGALAAVTPVMAEKMQELKTVDYLDVQKYMGTWYEIAKYPAPFEKNCYGVTATYSLLPNGNVRVINACKKGSITGPANVAKGKAWITDEKTNSKLKVMFFWPFSGAYWVIGLGKNYEYAVVGHPKRKFLWILARKPVLDVAVYNEILKKIEQQGYDLSKITKTPQ